jgi:oxygen-independent coproporphyrinogen-3 oxidase
MDHFARPDDELSRARRDRTLHRNFQGYTTKAGTDLIGMGVSAIGAVGNAFVQNRRELPAYRRDVGSQGSATFRGFRLSFDDRVRREVIGNLLCHGVVVIPEVEEAFGIAFSEYFAASLDRLSSCERDGLVEISASEVRATPLGRVFLRNLAMAFDAYLTDAPEKPTFSRTL